MAKDVKEVKEEAKKDEWLTYEQVEKKRGEGFEVCATAIKDGVKMYKVEKESK